MRRANPSRRQTAVLAIAAVAAALLVLTPVARAARPPVPAPETKLEGPHFVVHYTSTGGTVADRLTPEGAATALANAEAGLAWYLSQGYPAPLDDGDGKTDIYVFAVPIGPAAGRDSESVDQTSGFILLTPTANNIYAVSHELFHVIQFGIFAHSGFFSESSAEWAGQAVTAAGGGSPPPNWFPDPWVSLDCLGSGCGDAAGGYRGSIFWEYLSEHYGTGIVHEAFDREALLGAADHQAHDVQALGEALAAHGSSLAAALNGYALAAVAGQITRPGVLPHAPASSLALVPELPITYRPQSVTVNHLAMRVVSFKGAAGDAARCTKATLKLQVDLPAGVPAQPVFVTYPPSGLPPATAVYPLAISGSTAVGAVLTADEGTINDADTFRYEWLACTPGTTTCAAPYGNPSGKTYVVPTCPGGGYAIRVRVTGSNWVGSATTALSDEVLVPAHACPAPTFTGPGSLAGVLKVTKAGHNITFASGRWSVACTWPVPCSGVARLKARLGGHWVVLGTTSFVAPAGSTPQLAVHLRKKALKKLRTVRSAKGRLYLTATGPDRQASTLRVRLKVSHGKA